MSADGGRHLVKAWVVADGSDDPPEGLWVAELRPSEFEVHNIPVVAKGLNVKDVVDAELRDNLLTIVRVIRRSGHSTIHVLGRPGVAADSLTRLMRAVDAQGCRFEGATDTLSCDRRATCR